MSGFDIQQVGDRTYDFIDRITGTVGIELGRGATDTDISYLALRNAGGTLCYVYPDSTGTAIVVTTVKP